MALDLEDYRARLARMLQDVGEFLQPDDIDTYLFQAVLVYSKDRPLIKVHELTGDSSAFDFAVPNDWVEDFSYINNDIEYPVNDDIQSIPIIDKNNWKFIKKLVGGVTTLFIRFLTFTPASSEKARFEYATLHTIDEDTNTIKDGDSQAVLCLTAALCYWALASRFAQFSDSTIEADVIDYARKSELYTELAKEKITNYRSLMGIGEDSSRAKASAGIAIKDLDIMYPGSLGDYLTHPISTR